MLTLSIEQLFHTQLICFLALWGCHSFALIYLFLCECFRVYTDISLLIFMLLFFVTVVNRYKDNNFCEEEEDRAEAHREECEKRRLRMTRETGPGRTGDMIKPSGRIPGIIVLPPSPNDIEAQSPSTESEMSW
jgi:hypothetical protein